MSVKLTGTQMAGLSTVSGETGIFRFVSLSPATYEVRAELTGFKPSSQTGIVVNIGSNVEINLILEVGTLEEQVTVVAQTPVVDVKKTAVGQNIDKEAMQSLPTARDPWVVLQLAPSIMVDRENVGGNESGQQSGFVAKGDATGGMGRNQGANNIWSVDGIDITDPAALGGSALYYDFDMFEELNVTTGGAADVSVQTGGVALNMVTRRGGNRTSLAGRFYLTDNFFQSTNLTDELRAKGVLNTNKIQQIKDFGFNAGGPIIKDKLWWWGAYGVQDIFVYTITGNKDQSLLNNYNIKLNAQILPNNRFEALVTSGAKEKFGRNSSLAKPEGDHQTGKYHWGSPIVKLQDEHVFGNNIYLSLKYSFNDAGFGWRPIPDEGVIYPITYDNTALKYVPYKSGVNASWGSYGVARPRNNFQINASYFNDTLFNMSHEFKVGAEYSNKKQTYHTGNLQGFDVNRRYTDLRVDTNNDGTRTTAEMAGWQRIALYRSNEGADVADQYAGYVQDTITKGNFTATLGLRYDLQVPSAGAFTRSAVYGGEHGLGHGLRHRHDGRPRRHPARRPDRSGQGHEQDRQRRSARLFLVDLVAAPGLHLGHQRRRQDRGQAGPVAVRRRHGRRLVGQRPARHRAAACATGGTTPTPIRRPSSRSSGGVYRNGSTIGSELRHLPGVQRRRLPDRRGHGRAGGRLQQRRLSRGQLLQLRLFQSPVPGLRKRHHRLLPEPQGPGLHPDPRAPAHPRARAHARPVDRPQRDLPQVRQVRLGHDLLPRGLLSRLHRAADRRSGQPARGRLVRRGRHRSPTPSRSAASPTARA
ncbi:MAG: TonB-dependent receptor [Candidatus Moduliflexus flocculans]|nr:TonB-dependent receptor [Candidatus Moduliflexus flocculans]